MNYFIGKVAIFFRLGKFEKAKCKFFHPIRDYINPEFRQVLISRLNEMF